ncbi:Xre family transcriptional regulator [Roseiarcus fermentans]|uniref:Xre family transcriptional regulator n=1 Tax=Roseiarcus fermentans TaxID=1473586 RepID=A0A366FHB5_9HYPH|nr:helix-turn-helix transcriptional regulator [Roseiarcus fermentans]RBP14064.1 Xre family transcriptional regulator [Roseiarcus fermentans]
MPDTQIIRLTALAAEAEEDAADAAAYDEAMAALEGGVEVLLPAELSALILEGASLLAAVRKWRGLSQAELAQRTGLRQGAVSDLETGRRKGAQPTLERIASALDVPLNWIVSKGGNAG